MFWNKKDDKKSLPDLPALESPPEARLDNHDEDENEDTEKHSLPSFPDSPIKEGFSQAAIKDAVSDSEIEDQERYEENIKGQDKKSFKIIEMEDSFSNSMQKPISLPSSISPINSVSSAQTEKFQPNYSKPSQKSDIFVKIDKFHSAKKALYTARDQLEQIDSLLKKIRETKLREEQELTAWEKEIINVKSRIQDINENIFEKLE